MIIPYGKYKGKTLEWLEKNDKGYLKWAKENAPKLVTPPKPKPIIETKVIDLREDELPKAIQPNLNFWSEGPADICKPYLNSLNKK